MYALPPACRRSYFDGLRCFGHGHACFIAAPAFEQADALALLVDGDLCEALLMQRNAFDSMKLQPMVKPLSVRATPMTVVVAPSQRCAPRKRRPSPRGLHAIFRLPPPTSLGSVHEDQCP